MTYCFDCDEESYKAVLSCMNVEHYCNPVSLSLYYHIYIQTPLVYTMPYTGSHINDHYLPIIIFIQRLPPFVVFPSSTLRHW